MRQYKRQSPQEGTTTVGRKTKTERPIIDVILCGASLVVVIIVQRPRAGYLTRGVYTPLRVYVRMQFESPFLVELVRVQ